MKSFKLSRAKALLTVCGLLAAAPLPAAAKGSDSLPPPVPAHDCQAYSGIPAGFGPAQKGVANQAGLVPIPSGRFLMGSDEGYPEEKPVHPVEVQAFQIDQHEVTNAQFAQFVAATGYVTQAERVPEFPPNVQVPEQYRQPGSAVFTPPAATHDHDQHEGHEQHAPPGNYNWWVWVPGANWRHPGGPDTNLNGRDNHPVVHIAYEDALAYARWLGRDLPTEEQWEFAARGGLEAATYPWGNTPEVRGRLMANTWQGNFPAKNLLRDGYEGTAPVGCFPANNYELWDSVGNVWEWTRSAWQPQHRPLTPEPLIAAARDANGNPAMGVIKGGSFLCAANFCVRYRPASRQPQETTMSTQHVGFRTVLNEERK
ncbi:formylglycine-generating enzyme family protein [Alcaligenes faecalis]|jgi:formylglycine-generating enzyme required for sulfatase activity|uniref:Formylglycine-generating enzyme family protein n=1 Tax=Alcaligenes faecalis TaxID=511 RepID=A0ABY7N7B0_ALCFA|nr:formylglycine-generating enzyme family protein [Alcaligenes faecalis]ATH99066.1 formylglycine-generating enzyme family protein [Alcaligenes faecalis]AYZ91853.1 formylglycine-generating enzyme family protein [Alcaligenes faecalis]KAA1284423.1 formylglycine-generating enzyme family protein [Alcaligenes faecalis]MBQ0217240.1 formylglycine-generating enzyme family protein [Alcaligenes faecalis]MCX5595690.1 formylglycine-generating enzyme family protein [Alcaligenes faecalis]